MLAIAAELCAAQVQAKQSYRPRGFMKTGYSDQLVKPGEWSVRSSARERSESVGVALYRAAQLVDQAGATEFRIIRQQVKSTTVTRRNGYQEISYGEATELIVRAIRTEQDRVACAMPETARCMTLSVASVMATYGPKLAMPVAKPGAEPAPLLAIRASSPYERDFADFLARNPHMRAPTSSPLPAPVAVPPRIATRIAPTAVLQAPVQVRPVSTTLAGAYAARLKAAEPVRQGDPTQGWKFVD